MLRDPEIQLLKLLVTRAALVEVLLLAPLFPPPVRNSRPAYHAEIHTAVKDYHGCQKFETTL